MSTRSYIMKKVGQNKYLYNYCHHDGYPEGVGQDLYDKYKTEEDVDRLFENNSGFSVLPSNPKEVRFYEANNPPCEPTEFHFTESEYDIMIEYYYIWKKNKWYIGYYTRNKKFLIKPLEKEAKIRK